MIDPITKSFERDKILETLFRENVKEEYVQWCITPQTDINIASENAFLLGKDGCLYQTVSCGDDYYKFKPLKDSKFEKIRTEAIENDGEYEVQSW